MSINASLVEDIVSLEALREDLQGVVRGLQEELSRNVSIRTSPGESCTPAWLPGPGQRLERWKGAGEEQCPLEPQERGAAQWPPKSLSPWKVCKTCGVLLTWSPPQGASLRAACAPRA